MPSGPRRGGHRNNRVGQGYRYPKNKYNALLGGQVANALGAGGSTTSNISESQIPDIDSSYIPPVSEEFDYNGEVLGQPQNVGNAPGVQQSSLSQDGNSVLGQPATGSFPSRPTYPFSGKELLKNVTLGVLTGGAHTNAMHQNRNAEQQIYNRALIERALNQEQGQALMQKQALANQGLKANTDLQHTNALKELGVKNEQEYQIEEFKKNAGLVELGIKNEQERQQEQLKSENKIKEAYATVASTFGVPTEKLYEVLGKAKEAELQLAREKSELSSSVLGSPLGQNSYKQSLLDEMGKQGAINENNLADAWRKKNELQTIASGTFGYNLASPAQSVYNREAHKLTGEGAGPIQMTPNGTIPVPRRKTPQLGGIVPTGQPAAPVAQFSQPPAQADPALVESMLRRDQAVFKEPSVFQAPQAPVGMGQESILGTPGGVTTIDSLINYLRKQRNPAMQSPSWSNPGGMMNY